MAEVDAGLKAPRCKVGDEVIGTWEDFAQGGLAGALPYMFAQSFDVGHSPILDIAHIIRDFFKQWHCGTVTTLHIQIRCFTCGTLYIHRCDAVCGCVSTITWSANMLLQHACPQPERMHSAAVVLVYFQGQKRSSATRLRTRSALQTSHSHITS